MAEISSSSLITLIQQKYDVFISFRGEDTRESIVSHLYAALRNKQIKVFIDDKLERGDDVSEALLRTIKESKISIIIFSEKYCSSTWCLGELVHIMECKKVDKQIIIPVFFKVDPSHVRKQLGPFGEALAQHKDHLKIQTWRDALTEAANLSGWDSQVTRPEAKLIENIVKDVVNKLHYASASDNEDLVGISSRIKHIESMLSTCSTDVTNVKIIGIWGMGGIGKTTLAGAFFDKMSTQFEGYCFLANVREESQKRGWISLRNKLLNEVLKDVNINVSTPHLGHFFMRNRLNHIKALIVLDDVDDPNHLEVLAGGHKWFGRESVIIITCRDKQVLQGVDYIYKIPGLDDIEASSLFDRYAFKEKPQTNSYHWNLSCKAITYAKGNPLALRILGQHLHGKSEKEQESVMMKLERTPIKGIQQVLQVSYNGLDDEQRKLFINIACFFKGKHVNKVEWIHDALGYCTKSDIRVLIDKSLITVKNDQVWMHDLLQEMGRQIVHEECIKDPGKRSWLWDYADISHVLTKNTGTENIRGILLDSLNTNLSINSKAFEKMSNLEFLIFNFSCDVYPYQGLKSGNVYLRKGLKSLPNKICYLHWDEYPLRSLPSSFRPENLVKLKMRGGHQRKLWKGRPNLVHLKEVDLSYSRKLVEIPDLSLATNLKTFNLEKCRALKNVSFKNNCNLKVLRLHGCSLIKKFPEVPMEIEELYLDKTGIKEIPSSIFNLESLTYLGLSSCKNLRTSIDKSKPPLHVRELTDHPICSLELDLSDNDFVEIPFAIERLTNLNNLNISYCKYLRSLPRLPMNVEEINAYDCVSLKTVASPLFTAAKRLSSNASFSFHKCPNLNQDARNTILAGVGSTWDWTTIEPNKIHRILTKEGAHERLFGDDDDDVDIDDIDDDDVHVDINDIDDIDIYEYFLGTRYDVKVTSELDGFDVMVTSFP